MSSGSSATATRGRDDPSRPVQLPVPCRATPGARHRHQAPWASRDWRRFARHRGRSVSWLAAGALERLVSILLGVPARRGVGADALGRGGSGRRDPSRTREETGMDGTVDPVAAILEDPTVEDVGGGVPHHAPRGPGGSPARLGARRGRVGDPGDASPIRRAMPRRAASSPSHERSWRPAPEPMPWVGAQPAVDDSPDGR